MSSLSSKDINIVHDRNTRNDIRKHAAFVGSVFLLVQHPRNPNCLMRKKSYFHAWKDVLSATIYILQSGHEYEHKEIHTVEVRVSPWPC